MIKITSCGETTDNSMIIASAIKRFLSINDAKYTFKAHEFSEKMVDDHFHGYTYQDLKAGLWNKEIELNIFTKK